MIINYIILITISIILVIALSSTPINIGLWIILSTLVISTTISIFISSWWALILFLIYIGGLLVIFAYFVSIQPNQQIKIIKIILILIITTLLFIPLTSSYSIPITHEHTFISSIIEILDPANIQILLLLATVLFLALIAVVKITNIYIGPLRPFKYVFTFTKNSSPS